jgi:two-component system, NarL family, nitrate/nitrite response regulator NarL
VLDEDASVTATIYSDARLDPGVPSAKVLVVDDHQMIRETLARYLAEIGSVSVTEAEDFVSAFVAVAQQTDFDLVVLDIRMPGVDGFTTMATLRRLFPGLRVALLSGSVDLADMRRALEGGAVGYLPKSMDRGALVNALRLMLLGEKFFPAVFQSVEPQNYSQEAAVPGRSRVGAIELTPRQRAVLIELAKGMSNREIGNALGISEITVKIHVHSICQKLSVRNRVQAAQRGRSLGLLTG